VAQAAVFGINHASFTYLPLLETAIPRLCTVIERLSGYK